MPQRLCADDHIRVRIVNVHVHIPVLIYAAVLFCLLKCLVDHFFAGKSVRVLHHNQRHIRLSHQCVVGIVFQHHPSVALTGGGFYAPAFLDRNARFLQLRQKSGCDYIVRHLYSGIAKQFLVHMSYFRIWQDTYRLDPP